jgi:N-acetylglucosamine kinase-like BadF-type ATPase
LAEFDGVGQKTLLTSLLFDRLRVASAYELMGKYYSGECSRDHLAGLSLCVSEAAEDGDPVAVRILQQAGQDLARFARSIITLLFPLAAPLLPGGSKFLVCYSGGVFRSRIALASFRDTVLSVYAQVEICPSLLSPVLGSLLLAYRAAGVGTSFEISSRWAAQMSDLRETT